MQTPLKSQETRKSRGRHPGNVDTATALAQRDELVRVLSRVVREECSQSALAAAKGILEACGVTP